MKKFLLFSTIFLFLACNIFAFEIKGVKLPDTITVDNHKLILNGAGKRMKFFFTIYIGALYLPKKMSNAKDVIEKDIPKRILMHFIYSKVKPDQIIDAFKDDFENNAKDILPEIKKEINTFYSYFDKNLHQGDEVAITYLPEKGTCIKIQNQLKGCIKGKLFMKAIFSVWFGDDPPSEGLKDSMLGKE